MQLQTGICRLNLTSVACKVLESDICDKMVVHLINNNLISCHQLGFRSNRSCITQLLLIMEHWLRLIDQGNSVGAIYLNFQNTSDTVPHQRLIANMKSTISLIALLIGYHHFCHPTSTELWSTESPHHGLML